MFYDTIAIRERRNLVCQRTHLPPAFPALYDRAFQSRMGQEAQQSPEGPRRHIYGKQFRLLACNFMFPLV